MRLSKNQEQQKKQFPNKNFHRIPIIKAEENILKTYDLYANCYIAKRQKIIHYVIYILAWIIHKSRLLQMRGAGYEAVVLHRKYPVTNQMQ